VKEYNELLDDSFPLLETPLLAEAELEDDEMLAAYREFKRMYKNRSPHPFVDFCAYKVFIARTIIESVKSRGIRIRASVQGVLKGEELQNVEFKTQRAYMPSPWFKKGEESLVFLSRYQARADKPTFTALGYGDRMPVIREPEGIFVLSFNCRREFWKGFEYSVLDMAGYDSAFKLRLEPVSAAIKKQPKSS